jgi:hypothetical protein
MPITPDSPSAPAPSAAPGADAKVHISDVLALAGVVGPDAEPAPADEAEDEAPVDPAASLGAAWRVAEHLYQAAVGRPPQGREALDQWLGETAREEDAARADAESAGHAIWGVPDEAAAFLGLDAAEIASTLWRGADLASSPAARGDDFAWWLFGGDLQPITPVAGLLRHRAREWSAVVEQVPRAFRTVADVRRWVAAPNGALGGRAPAATWPLPMRR